MPPEDLFYPLANPLTHRVPTSFQGSTGNPELSPDGIWIAFNGTYGGNTDVWIVAVAGGEPRRLTWHPSPDVVQGWTPDGRAVVFTSPRSAAPSGTAQTFWKVSRDGGMPEPVGIPRGNQGAFSADGKRFAYRLTTSWDEGWRNYRGGQNRPIWIANVGTWEVESPPWTDSKDIEPVWVGETVYVPLGPRLAHERLGLRHAREAAAPGAPGLGLPDPFQPAIAMAAITSKVIGERLDAQNVPEADRKNMQRCRANNWWSKKEYKAPTHEGVWATAPYLHNGSIPNLYLVLSPKEERDKQAGLFCVGHDLTYDPANVGFKLTDQCPDLFKFDTTLRNNGNKGHEFRKAPDCEKREGPDAAQNGIVGCELSDHERKALVEYLKTL